MGMENKVKELRDKIDDIDLKILDLIQSRANHASKIGEIKKESPDFDGVFYKPEREKEIITARRLSDDPVTLEKLSKKYKISRERIRQIETKAFEKLQKSMINASKSKNLLPAN